MTHTFTDALAVVLREEGGYVNDKRDPGGITNLGVTARTWSGWTGHPATDADMRVLTPAMVAPLYRANYWDKIDGDSLPSALALCVFDFGVNAGPSRAVKALQGVCGAAQDGAIGPGTLRAVQAYLTSVGLAKLIGKFSDARQAYYEALPTFGVFGHGWTQRVIRMKGVALSWVG